MPDLHARPPLRLAAPEAPAAALVLCHGRGATAESLAPLAAALAGPGLAVLAPRADALGGVPQWYPASFLAPLARNEPFLSAAFGAVGRAVEAARALGLADDRVAIGGFSQGACLAAEFAARHARRWGGVVAFSGGLIGTAEAGDASPTLRGAGGVYPDKRFDYGGSLDGTLVVLGCAENDPHIPLARLRRSAEVLAALGGAVDLRVYPGAAHAVVEDEVRAARALVGSLVAGSA